jgi:hypothetical protein
MLGMVLSLDWTSSTGLAVSVVLSLALNEGTAVPGGDSTGPGSLVLGIPSVVAGLAFGQLKRNAGLGWPAPPWHPSGRRRVHDAPRRSAPDGCPGRLSAGRATVKDEEPPRRLGTDRPGQVACVQACLECSEACTIRADACLGEDMVAGLRACIRMNQDRATICAATAEVLSRQTATNADVLRALAEACKTACHARAEDCDRHAEMHDHCRVCSESCRNCERACRLPQRRDRQPPDGRDDGGAMRAIGRAC